FCQLTVYRNFNGFCFLISHFLLFLPTFSAEDSYISAKISTPSKRNLIAYITKGIMFMLDTTNRHLPKASLTPNTLMAALTT
ncbi:MAG: hypothetical protein KH451_06305, partial [Holdemanella biformis]|nr:hypothetical protein [Holdemanella biformis]